MQVLGLKDERMVVTGASKEVEGKGIWRRDTIRISHERKELWKGPSLLPLLWNNSQDKYFIKKYLIYTIMGDLNPCTSRSKDTWIFIYVTKKNNFRIFT